MSDVHAKAALTEDEMQRLALVTDVTHDDCYATTERDTCALYEQVEHIIAVREQAAGVKALDEAADEAWGRATEATSEDSSWRGVTRWLRDRRDREASYREDQI